MINKNNDSQNQKQGGNQQHVKSGENQATHVQKDNDSRNDNKNKNNITNEEPELPGHNDDSGKTIRETPRMNSL
jgi:hypothetical protein